MRACCMLQVSFAIPPLTLLFSASHTHLLECHLLSHSLMSVRFSPILYFASDLTEGIVGLKDPLREGVVEAIHRMQDSGAKVRGDERR